MKVLARGNRFFLKPNHLDNDFQKKLRYTRYNRETHLFYTLATPASMIDIMRNFPEAFNHDDDRTLREVKRLQNITYRLDQLQQGLKEEDREVKLPEVIDYVWDPFPHQKEALAFSLNLPKCALWLDMGLGKTYTSITLAKLRNKLNNVNTVLVVSPKSLIYQWETEIKTLAPSATVVKITGSRKQKLDALEGDYNSDFIFYIVSYESIGILLDNYVKFDMFILDEATKIKNPDAKRTLETREVCADIPYGVELTGMAYVNNPLDLYSQLSLLDPTIYGENKWAFSNRYIIYKTIGRARVIDHFYNMDELKKRAYLISFSRTKSSCLGLPEKVYQVRKLGINTSQFEWYDNLVGQLSSDLTTGLLEPPRGMSESDIDSDSSSPKVTVEYVVSMLEKLQQVTSGFVKADTGEYLWLDSPKYDELLDICQGTNDSIIIWARHTYTINKIVDKLKAKHIYAEVLTRSTKDDMRRYLKEQFKSGKIKVLILQIQSECRGNDFTCAVSPVTAIFFENTASVEERFQAEDRQHRIGMKGTALYIDLVCEDTYDEGIKMLLDSKKNISEFIREKNLTILLGKGGSIQKSKTKNVKKKPKSPSEIKSETLALPEFQSDWVENIPGLDDF